MEKKYIQFPFFVFLVPVFFVLHGYSQNFGFINFSECLLLMGTYLIPTVALYFSFYLLFKNHIKASLAAGLLISFYLFFGSIHDFLNDRRIFLHKYIIILPAFAILLIIVIGWLKKTGRTFARTSLFFNVLLVLYLLIDLVVIVSKIINPPANKFAVYSFVGTDPYRVCQGCQKPDIYLLLFDEYSSSSSLSKVYNYDNNGLDSFLHNEGFHILTASRSNYNITPFSMASILNMSYLRGVHDGYAAAEDYAYSDKLIRDNEVIKFLSYQGYSIINYSIFDLAGNPSRVDEDFLPLKTKLITSATLFSRMKRDLGWHLYMGRLAIRALGEKRVRGTLDNNSLLLELTKKESELKTDRPRFIYTHVEMPHYPFFFDKSGNRRSDSLMNRETPDNTIEGYLGYIPYTNNKLKDLIKTIQKNTGRKAVIIFMGDHGFRYENRYYYPASCFQNQNAVYFPDGDYSLFYDSITGVNQFRVVFNKIFNQKIPMLKDSVIFLQ